jgi:Asp/Glu/hydantoin racemase
MKILVLVPFPFDEKGIANRRRQSGGAVAPGIEIDYRPVRASPDLFDSHHDYLLADVALFEAGLDAAEEGYDAVCIDTMGDEAMPALRSVLDIPVVGPGQASYLMALMLGNRFSVLTLWDPWIASYEKTLREYGLAERCASIRSINIAPDEENLLEGQEEVVFPLLVDAALRCVEDDGADVICLGSTTMHEAHAHLVANVPVPVINPGPLTYQLAAAMIDLGLTHSRTAYPRPHVPKLDLVRAMLDGAAASP